MCPCWHVTVHVTAHVTERNNETYFAFGRNVRQLVRGGSRATLPIFFPLRPNRALASDLRTIESDDQIRMARDRPQLNKTRSFHSSITLVK